MRLVVLLLVAMTVTAAPQSPESPQSSNLQSFISQLSGDDRPGEVNGDNEQVPYTTLQKFNGYEEREYPIIKWACTEETYPMEEPEEEGEEDTGDWNLASLVKMMSKLNWKKRPSSKMFMRLFRYISGVNEEREEIEMTVPVLSKKTPNEDGTMMTTKMCFYLGSEHQANPPQPEDGKVKIEQTKAMTVFVHMFGGYAMRDSVWNKEALKFAKKLEEDGRIEEVKFGSYFTAGYDSPMKFWNRRNEVMYLKKPTVI